MASSSRNGNGNARQRRSRRNLRRPTNRGRSFPFWLKGLIALGVLGFAGLLTAFAVGVVAYRSYAADLVAPDELAINEPSYGAKIFDRNGLLLYEYVDDRSGLRRPVKLDQIADAFLAATIATASKAIKSVSRRSLPRSCCHAAGSALPRSSRRLARSNAGATTNCRIKPSDAITMMSACLISSTWLQRLLKRNSPS